MLKRFDQEDIKLLSSLIEKEIENTSDNSTLAKLDDLKERLNSREDTVYCISGFYPSDLSSIFDADEEKVSELSHEDLIALRDTARDSLETEYLVELTSAALDQFDLNEDEIL